MIESLVAKVFDTRNKAHIQHWKETSGFAHETLGSFYEDSITGIDDVVEAYQGVFDLISIDGVDDIVKQLEEDLLFIGQNRKEITKGLPAIDNLLQELEHTYMKTLYKLKRLK